MAQFGDTKQRDDEWFIFNGDTWVQDFGNGKDKNGNSILPNNNTGSLYREDWNQNITSGTEYNLPESNSQISYNERGNHGGNSSGGITFGKVADLNYNLGSGGSGDFPKEYTLEIPTSGSWGLGSQDGDIFHPSFGKWDLGEEMWKAYGSSGDNLWQRDSNGRLSFNPSGRKSVSPHIRGFDEDYSSPDSSEESRSVAQTGASTMNKMFQGGPWGRDGNSNEFFATVEDAQRYIDEHRGDYEESIPDDPKMDKAIEMVANSYKPWVDGKVQEREEKKRQEIKEDEDQVNNMTPEEREKEWSKYNDQAQIGTPFTERETRRFLLLNDLVQSRRGVLYKKQSAEGSEVINSYQQKADLHKQYVNRVITKDQYASSREPIDHRLNDLKIAMSEDGRDSSHWASRRAGLLNGWDVLGGIGYGAASAIRGRVHPYSMILAGANGFTDIQDNHEKRIDYVFELSMKDQFPREVQVTAGDIFFIVNGMESAGMDVLTGEGQKFIIQKVLPHIGGGNAQELTDETIDTMMTLFGGSGGEPKSEEWKKEFSLWLAAQLHKRRK